MMCVRIPVKVVGLRGDTAVVCVHDTDGNAWRETVSLALLTDQVVSGDYIVAWYGMATQVIGRAGGRQIVRMLRNLLSEIGNLSGTGPTVVPDGVAMC